MKKFYVSPVVEITVFDVEDVITTSVIDTRTLEAQDFNALINDIQNESGTGVKVVNFEDNSYTW